MRVMIDIPKEFEEDLKDNFQDFFNRVIADITYSLNDEELMCCGNYERETAEMFLSAFEKATVIPDDATNGDVIKAIFPYARVGEIFLSFNDDEIYYVPIEKFNGVTNEMRVMKSWWNAPYKKEVEE